MSGIWFCNKTEMWNIRVNDKQWLTVCRKTETMQDIFKKLQNNLRPNTTIPKIRSNKHQRSSSVNKINMDPSPDVTRPSRPTPVCPNRSQSFTGPRLSMAARNTSLPGLSVSTDKAGINLALYSMNSSEGVTPRTSFLSGSFRWLFYNINITWYLLAPLSFTITYGLCFTILMELLYSA